MRKVVITLFSLFLSVVVLERCGFFFNEKNFDDLELFFIEKSFAESDAIKDEILSLEGMLFPFEKAAILNIKFDNTHFDSVMKKLERKGDYLITQSFADSLIEKKRFRFQNGFISELRIYKSKSQSYQSREMFFYKNVLLQKKIKCIMDDEKCSDTLQKEYYEYGVDGKIAGEKKVSKEMFFETPLYKVIGSSMDSTECKYHYSQNLIETMNCNLFENKTCDENGLCVSNYSNRQYEFDYKKREPKSYEAVVKCNGWKIGLLSVETKNETEILSLILPEKKNLMIKDFSSPNNLKISIISESKNIIHKREKLFIYNEKNLLIEYSFSDIFIDKIGEENKVDSSSIYKVNYKISYDSLRRPLIVKYFENRGYVSSPPFIEGVYEYEYTE